MDSNSQIPTPEQNSDTRSVGPAVGIIIIIILIVAGALYFWGKHQSELRQIQSITPATTTDDSFTPSSPSSSSATTSISVTP